MPPIVPNRDGRAAQVLFANPQNQTKVLSQQPSPAVVFASPTSDDWEFSPFDIGKCVEGTSSSAQTFTIPVSTDTPFPLNCVIEVFQAGAGQITIVGAAGVTLSVPAGYTATTGGQNATIGLRQRVLDQWVLNGFLGT